MNHRIARALFCLGMLFLTACNDNFVYDKYQSISEIGWHKDSIANFQLPQLDSLKTYDLFVNARNNSKYPYSNLFLITEMQYPNGKRQIDTLEYEMAHPNGEWIGTGGHLIENKLWYKEGFSFRESGSYHIKISHAMRKNGKEKGIEFLSGITDIGFRIETTKNIP